MDKATRTALSTIAAAQHGLLSVAQAREIGVANRQLVRAEARGQLRRVRRGVYAIGGMPPSPWEHVVGAALAAGREAVISHANAAAVHRFEYGATNAVELTVRRSCRSRPAGVVVHRSRDLTPEDLVRKGGVLVTSPCRTLGALRPFEVHFSVVIGGNVYVLDAAWPALRVGAEIVGRSHRLASLTAFERERRKLNALSGDGWKIAHLTAGMSPAEMVDAVRAFLAQAGGAQ
jgi:Transcriptional regulator, AbiEi antitoxin